MKQQPRTDVIAELHKWPVAGQGSHTLDRDCECKPTIEATKARLNDFVVRHRDDPEAKVAL